MIGDAAIGEGRPRMGYLFAFLLLMLCASSGIASTGSEILRTKAQLAYANGDYPGALVWLEQAIEADGEDLLARYYRGLTHARLRNYAQAQQDLQQVAAAGAHYPTLQYELGVIAFRQQAYPSAEVALQRALQENPQDNAAAYYLGATLHHMGRYAQALAPLHEAEQRKGAMMQASRYLQAESLFHLGRQEEGRGVLQRLLESDNGWRIFDFQLYPDSDVWRSTEAEDTLARTLFSVTGMELHNAASLLDDWLVHNPNDHHARFIRGVIAARLGDFAAARAELVATLASDMEHAELHHEMGYVAYRLGNYDEASQQLTQGLAENPQHRRSHYYLGRVLQKQGESELALQQLQLAGVTGEIGAAALYSRAEILASVDRTADARQLLQRVEEEHPQSSYAKKAYALDRTLAVSGILPQGLQVEISAGIVHDSNVALYSSDLPLPTTLSDRGDNRLQLGVDMKWQPSAGPSQPFTFGYRLFQSRHQNLQDYDLRNHTLSAAWKQQHDALEWGVTYQYQMASLNNYDYMRGHSFTPHLMVSHSVERLSLFKLQWRNEVYDYPNLQDYDGNRYNLSYRYFWLLSDKRYLSAGLEGERELTENDNYASRKEGVNAAAQWDWQGMVATLNLSYLMRDFPDAVLEREDRILKAGMRLRYPLGRQSQLEATLNHIDNTSNLEPYDYNRVVYGMTIKWNL